MFVIKSKDMKATSMDDERKNEIKAGAMILYH